MAQGRGRGEVRHLVLLIASRYLTDLDGRLRDLHPEQCPWEVCGHHRNVPTRSPAIAARNLRPFRNLAAHGQPRDLRRGNRRIEGAGGTRGPATLRARRPPTEPRRRTGDLGPQL